MGAFDILRENDHQVFYYYWEGDLGIGLLCDFLDINSVLEKD